MNPYRRLSFASMSTEIKAAKWLYFPRRRIQIIWQLPFLSFSLARQDL